MKRLWGLDGIRFCAAMAVVLGHLSPLQLFDNEAGGLGLVVNRFFRTAFNGPAAVVVFFVLSGLVIHYPTITNRQSIGPSFFLRRYIRILGPVFAALACASLAGGRAPQILQGVLWSLWAELIYYTLYPFLLPLGRRLGWAKLVGLSCIPAYLISVFHGNTNFVLGDIKTDWIVGLPCWLAGCWVAESLGQRAVSAVEIWSWRVGIWALSAVLLMLRFHSPLTYGYTLIPFALPVAMWLIREVSYYGGTAEGVTTRRPWRWLEQAGTWSFSLYIAHPIASTWLQDHHAVLGAVGKHELSRWLSHLSIMLVFAYAFSRLFERPSHRLARWCAAAVAVPRLTRETR